MTPDEIAREIVATHTGLYALDTDRDRMVERIAAAIRAERERADEARRMMKATVPISGDGQYVLIDGFGDQWIDYDDERLKRAEAAEAERDRLRDALAEVLAFDSGIRRDIARAQARELLRKTPP